MVEMQRLSDCELNNGLVRLGFSPGPILPSTRKVYENKLVQLLISPLCEPPASNGSRNPAECEDSDDSEELNIILKGNVTLSTEKGKESRKNQVFETQGQQEDIVKPNCNCKRLKMLTKQRPKSSNCKRTLDICCLGQKPNKKIRCAARSPNVRTKHSCATQEKDYCLWTTSLESDFPWSLKLAVFGIFIIVVFVYITVEKKPLFS